MRRFEAAFAEAVVRHRWRTLCLALLCILGAASGLRLLAINNNHRLYFSADNPELLAFNALEETFGTNDTVTFVVVPPDGEVFSRDSLRLIQQLTTRAWKLPFAIRVDSLTNFQYSHATGDELYVHDLVEDPAALDAHGLAAVREIALHEPQLRGALIRDDARVTAVNVRCQLPRRDEAHEVPLVVDAARALAREFETQYPGLRVHLTGVLLMDHAFAEAALHDVRTLLPVSFVIMLVTLGILLGRIASVAVTLLVIVLAIASAMGLAGYARFPLSAATSTAPIIILTVAVANCVHVLESYLQGLRAGLAQRAAVLASVQSNLRPVFIASLTTVIGFLTFNFSDVPPFRQLGNIVAFGDFTSYLLAVTLLPAILMILPAPRSVHAPAIERLIVGAAKFSLSHRRALCMGFGALVVALTACLPRNVLDDVFIRYFDEATAFRRDADFTVANLTGVYHFYYTLDSGESDGVTRPAFMRDTAAFVDWLRAQPEVRHVTAYTDVMRRLNRNMHGDDPAYDRLPTSRALAAQYLLLYEMSLPYGLDLNNQIDIRKSAVKVTAAVETLSSVDALALNQRAEDWLRSHASHVRAGTGSGSALMLSRLGQRNIKSMLGGTVVALVLISVILLLVLRSLKLGLLSLLPNLVPLAMGFGLWGLLVGEVGLSLSVVASMALGIIIDDTVHFLVKYQRARQVGGLSAYAAVEHAFIAVGPAMLVTSSVLIAGFLVLALSDFELNSGMGLLTAIVIAFAFCADLFFLAPCLLLLEAGGSSGKQTQ